MSFDIQYAKQLKEKFQENVRAIRKHIAYESAPEAEEIKAHYTPEALAEALEDFDSETIAAFIFNILEQSEDIEEAKREMRRQMLDSVRDAIISLGENIEEHL